MSKFNFLGLFIQILVFRMVQSQRCGQSLNQGFYGTVCNSNGGGLFGSNACLSSVTSSVIGSNFGSMCSYKSGLGSNAGGSGGFGGVGTGQLAVVGEVPISGNTYVDGNLPILGLVEFAGSLPASGAVTVAGCTPSPCVQYSCSY